MAVKKTAEAAKEAVKNEAEAIKEAVKTEAQAVKKLQQRRLISLLLKRKPYIFSLLERKSILIQLPKLRELISRLIIRAAYENSRYM